MRKGGREGKKEREQARKGGKERRNEKGKEVLEEEGSKKGKKGMDGWIGRKKEQRKIGKKVKRE